MIEAKMPSGAILKITPAPFEDAKALCEAFFEELKAMKLDPYVDVDVNFYKDIVMAAMSSKRFEKALQKCMERAIYGDDQLLAKELPKIFEPIDNRQDYYFACYEVAQVNITPFMKGLYAEWSRVLAMLQKSPA